MGSGNTTQAGADPKDIISRGGTIILRDYLSNTPRGITRFEGGNSPILPPLSCRTDSQPP